MKKNKSSMSISSISQMPTKFSSAQDIPITQNYKQNTLINSQYCNRFVGEWQEDNYKVIRRYIRTKSPGISLYITQCVPLKSQATLIILHGYSDHSGRYMHLADEFCKSGFQVILYDQRGFGQSGGIRGVASIADMHQDLESVLREVERTQPIILYCQSLGAALGLSFCIANPTLNLQGVIVVNPYLQLAKKYGFFKKILLQLSNLLIPNLMINSYIDYAHCSKNNYTIRSVAEDQLILPIMSIKMAHNFLLLDQYILPNASKFNQPILIIHGKEDKVASHMNSIELYRHIGTQEKTLKLFEKGFHELQNDVEFDRLKNTVISWCTKQVIKDKRISYIRKLNHGIKINKGHIKFIILQLLMMYFLLKNKLGNLGRLGRTISIISLLLGSLIVHLRW